MAMTRWFGVMLLAVSLGACLSDRQGTVGTDAADSSTGTDTAVAADTAWPEDTSVGPYDTSLGSYDTHNDYDSHGSYDTYGLYDTYDAYDTHGWSYDTYSAYDTHVDTASAVDTSGGDVVTIGCPQAVITVAEGSEVIPQTVLHLSGEGSHGLAPIVQYEWTVEQPSGSASVFAPSSSHPNPVFEANVAGQYIFHLRVYDAEGRASCQVATYVVLVVAVDAIHIELLWTTPEDPDETDVGYDDFGQSVGSDVDLHLLHPSANTDVAPGGWFDSRWDCYWSNGEPNWGGPGASDDPGLDRDDTDGAGPENVNLAAPEDGLSYRIGVHYWDDWGFGASIATVRVYVHGQLVLETPPMQLAHGDLWEVGAISWPDGEVTVNTGPDAVTPDYPVPFF